MSHDDTATDAAPAASRFDLTEEQQALAELTRRIAEEHFRARALDWEQNGEFPWSNIERLAEAGLLGMSVPPEYGGGGGTWLDAAVVLEEIARCCYVTAMAALGEVGVQTRAIAAFGSDEQKQRWLPQIASGEAICAICITEPDVGSDVGSLRTEAVKHADGYTIRGRKALISRADVASVLLVYARFDGVPGTDGVGAALLDAATPGIHVGRGFETLGGERLFEIEFDDVAIGEDDVLLGAGGLRDMLSAFNGQRCLNAAISVGIAQGALDVGLQQCKERVQFGQPIADFQGIRWVLADCAIEIEAARALVRRAAHRAGSEFPSRYDSSLAKVFANEMAHRVTDRVLHLFGGHGFLREMPAERYVRWARYGGLGGGTPHILRNGIARELLRGSGA